MQPSVNDCITPIAMTWLILAAGRCNYPSVPGIRIGKCIDSAVLTVNTRVYHDIMTQERRPDICELSQSHAIPVSTSDRAELARFLTVHLIL